MNLHVLHQLRMKVWCNSPIHNACSFPSSWSIILSYWRIRENVLEEWTQMTSSGNWDVVACKKCCYFHFCSTNFFHCSIVLRSAEYVRYFRLISARFHKLLMSIGVKVSFDIRLTLMSTGQSSCTHITPKGRSRWIISNCRYRILYLPGNVEAGFIFSSSRKRSGICISFWRSSSRRRTILLFWIWRQHRLHTLHSSMKQLMSDVSNRPYAFPSKPVEALPPSVSDNRNLLCDYGLIFHINI